MSRETTQQMIEAYQQCLHQKGQRRRAYAATLAGPTLCALRTVDRIGITQPAQTLPGALLPYEKRWHTRITSRPQTIERNNGAPASLTLFAAAERVSLGRLLFASHRIIFARHVREVGAELHTSEDRNIAVCIDQETFASHGPFAEGTNAANGFDEQLTAFRAAVNWVLSGGNHSPADNAHLIQSFEQTRMSE